jgi:hypothetical protein
MPYFRTRQATLLAASDDTSLCLNAMKIDDLMIAESSLNLVP